MKNTLCVQSSSSSLSLIGSIKDEAAKSTSRWSVGALCFSLSSRNILCSCPRSYYTSTTRRPSVSRVFASIMKWLSQWGQYSSASSNSSTCLRKARLHFLHKKIISIVGMSSWSSPHLSMWHSGQSNHNLQQGARTATCALRMCLHIFPIFLWFIKFKF